jgi:predicted RNase H-like HicB family nuclease
MTKTYLVTIEKTEDGYYAEVPSVNGVYAQGDTEMEVLHNLQEVLQMTLEDMKEKGENIESIKSFPQISFSAVNVTL